MTISTFKRNTIGLIASHTNIFISNGPLFENADANFIFIGCDKNDLADQPFITQKIITNRHRECDRKITELLSDQNLIASLPEFNLFDMDDLMLQVCLSSLPITLKSKLLPVKNPEYLDVSGSKIGQAKLFKNLNIPHPATQIIESKTQVPSLPYPFLAKADRHGGGAYVKLIHGLKDFDSFIQEHPFPILTQEFITGTEYSVEIFYRNGELIFAQFSEASFLVNGNGPSAKRKFFMDIPGDVLRPLEILGAELKYDGIVNCSFFQESVSGQYLIFEFDSRLNSWSHLATRLGFDASNYFSVKPVKQNSNSKYDNNYLDVIDLNRWVKCLTANPRTKEFKSKTISVMNLLEFKNRGGLIISSYPLVSFKSLPLRFVLSPLFFMVRKLFRKLPFCFRNFFMKRGMTIKVARLLKN